MQGSRRSLILLSCLVALSLGLAGCSSEATEEPQAIGSLSLALEIGDGIQIDEVDWTITGGEMTPMSGSINTSAPGSTASVEVFGLPPTEGDDYTITLQGTATDGVTTCEGLAGFGVAVDQVTEVMVLLRCKLPPRYGAVGVNGELNVCAELTKAVVSPLQTSVGGETELASQAVDAEGAMIAYRWSGMGGTIGMPGAASTIYTCAEEGSQSVTIEVSDDGFEYCISEWTVAVTCVRGEPSVERSFNRVASFLVCSQIDQTCNDDTTTASEIVAASTDGPRDAPARRRAELRRG
ncbi:MAG: hypothetical protein WCE62_22055 [Polyangiales bacterium]